MMPEYSLLAELPLKRELRKSICKEELYKASAIVVVGKLQRS